MAISKSTKMRNFLILLTVICTVSSIDCDKSDDNSVEQYPLNILLAQGYDDFSSEGAAFAMAVDTLHNAALIIALRFNLPFYQGEFKPTSDISKTIREYNWNRQNSITLSILNRWQYCENFMTDTQGIRTMGVDMAAFLVFRPDSTSLKGKFFIAKSGRLSLTRMEGNVDLVEGDLTFAEITSDSTTASVKANGEQLKIEDIYFEFSTTDQPK